MPGLIGVMLGLGLGIASLSAQTVPPPPATSSVAPGPATAEVAPSPGTAEPARPEAPHVEAAPPRVATVGTLPQNLSPWGMFANADIVVQAVMVGLGFASVVTWTVWLAKSLELLASIRAGRRSLPGRRRPITRRGNGRRAGSRSAVAKLVEVAAHEADASVGLPAEGLKERVVSRLERVEAAAGRRMTRGTGLLATIGATAPFVGLFGTVWGIMNAFVGISKAQTTNLAVVAPSIAEALLATAIGLVAAIPAVVIYNVFARWIAGYRHLLSDASHEVLRHVSRDLDRARRPMLRAAE